MPDLELRVWKIQDPDVVFGSDFGTLPHGINLFQASKFLRPFTLRVWCWGKIVLFDLVVIINDAGVNPIEIGSIVDFGKYSQIPKSSQAVEIGVPPARRVYGK